MDNYKLEVIPGILEKEWGGIEGKLEKIKSFSKNVHIDIIDRNFADNATYIEFENFKKYSSDIFLEAHLMVENPIQYLDTLSKNGFKRFLGHIEKMPDIEEFIAQGQILGEVGLALDGPTDISKLLEISLDNLDCVLIYAGKKVGFSGAPLLPERLEKISALRQKTNIPIEVDGGINDTTIQMAKSVGATRFVATSFIWNGTPKDNYGKLNKLLHQ